MTTGRPDFTAYTLIRGQDPDGNLVTIAVDASGNILGVLKGDYAGTLKTIAVDDQGRIQAVLSDPEDVFGNPGYMGAAELAARLGAINSFERRGTTVFLDGFENGFSAWSQGTNGSGGDVRLQEGGSQSLAYCVELRPPSTTGDYLNLHRPFPIPVVSRLGFQVSFAFIDDSSSPYVFLAFRGPTTGYYAGWKYDIQNRDLYYLSGITHANWTLLDNNFWLLAEASGKAFHHFKLVFDPDTGKYLRFIIDDTQIDMSAISLPSTGGATPSYFDTELGIIRVAGMGNYIYADDVIITQNEPA